MSKVNYSHPGLLSYEDALGKSNVVRAGKALYSSDPDAQFLSNQFPSLETVSSAKALTNPVQDSRFTQIYNAVRPYLPSAEMVGDWAAPILSAAGAQYANSQSVRQAQQAQDFGQDSADKLMAWQERLSGTAHQREMLDLKRAGLNPILAANLRGASTPSGGMVGGQQGDIENILAGAVHSAQANKRMNQEAKESAARIKLTEGQAKTVDLLNEASESWLGTAVRYGAKGAEVIGGLAKAVAAFL